MHNTTVLSGRRRVFFSGAARANHLTPYRLTHSLTQGQTLLTLQQTTRTAEDTPVRGPCKEGESKEGLRRLKRALPRAPAYHIRGSHRPHHGRWHAWPVHSELATCLKTNLHDGIGPPCPASLVSPRPARSCALRLTRRCRRSRAADGVRQRAGDPGQGRAAHELGPARCGALGKRGAAGVPQLCAAGAGGILRRLHLPPCDQGLHGPDRRPDRHRLRWRLGLWRRLQGRGARPAPFQPPRAAGHGVERAKHEPQPILPHARPVRVARRQAHHLRQSDGKLDLQPESDQRARGWARRQTRLPTQARQAKVRLGTGEERLASK
eukprot:scaffold2004_cov107-Isochrysis_galbana.AAC.2